MALDDYVESALFGTSLIDGDVDDEILATLPLPDENGAYVPETPDEHFAGTPAELPPDTPGANLLPDVHVPGTPSPPGTPPGTLPSVELISDLLDAFNDDHNEEEAEDAQGSPVVAAMNVNGTPVAAQSPISAMHVNATPVPARSPMHINAAVNMNKTPCLSRRR